MRKHILITIRTVFKFTYSPRDLHIVLFSIQRTGINAKQSDGIYVPYYLDITIYIERDINIWRGTSRTAAESSLTHSGKLNGMYAVPSLLLIVTHYD